MNNEQLKRTLGLLRRTGDRGIVLDPGSDEIFVLLDADDYERILDKKLPTKDGGDGFEDYVLDDLLDIEEKRKTNSDARLESIPELKEQISNEKQKLSFAEDWVNKKKPILNEESLTDVPHEGEEEEKFYLEPVE